MSEPKDKAKELIEKFKPNAYADWSDVRGWDESSRDLNAAICAAACVDEIVNNLTTQSIIAGPLTYWQEVKKEIEIL